MRLLFTYARRHTITWFKISSRSKLSTVVDYKPAPRHCVEDSAATRPLLVLRFLPLSFTMLDVTPTLLQNKESNSTHTPSPLMRNYQSATRSNVSAATSKTSTWRSHLRQVMRTTKRWTNSKICVLGGNLIDIFYRCCSSSSVVRIYSCFFYVCVYEHLSDCVSHF